LRDLRPNIIESPKSLNCETGSGDVTARHTR
jgi:hypothetical protein